MILTNMKALKVDAFCQRRQRQNAQIRRKWQLYGRRFRKMMPIVKANLPKSFKGYIGIEYEGGVMKMMGSKENYLDEDAGIKATKALLEKALLS